MRKYYCQIFLDAYLIDNLDHLKNITNKYCYYNCSELIVDHPLLLNSNVQIYGSHNLRKLWMNLYHFTLPDMLFTLKSSVLTKRCKVTKQFIEFEDTGN